MPPAKTKVQKLARTKRHPRGRAAKTVAEAVAQIARFREAQREQRAHIVSIDPSDLQQFQNQCAERRHPSVEAEDRRRARVRAKTPFTIT